jgi:alpha-D-xyloside xylohydrolase
MTEGGAYVQAATPLERMPLYVRAGSILPLGPDEQYADEKADGPIELRVYRGADGSFNLYEDEGDTYNYEKGARAVIPIAWSEAQKTLTIGARSGSYAGMPGTMTFHVVWVRAGHGVGIETEQHADATVEYTGAAVTVKADRGSVRRM